MPVPDFKAMSDAELVESVNAAELESKRRGTFRDADRYVRDAVQSAKDLGVSKTQVANFLTRIVNDIYPTT